MYWGVSQHAFLHPHAQHAATSVQAVGRTITIPQDAGNLMSEDAVYTLCYSSQVGPIATIQLV